MSRKRVLSTMIVAIAVAVLVSAGVASAGLEAALTLEIDGAVVEGENTGDLGRDATIKVIAMSSGVTNGTPRVHQPFTIIKPIDKSTPHIFKALVTNQTVTSALIRVFRPAAGGGEELYYSILLGNASVSAISSASGENDGEQREMVSILFHDITVTHEPTGVSHSDSWTQGS